MKVLLIQAPLGRRQPPVMPLGLAYVARSLAPAHQVRIADPNIQSSDSVLELAGTFRPDAVGVSLRNVDTTQVRDPFCYYARFRPFVRQLRRAVGPGTPIVVGGPGYSLFPLEILRGVPELDAGFRGDGEDSLARWLVSPDDETIPGLVYRSEGAVMVGPPPAPAGGGSPDLEALDLERYRRFEGNWAVGVETHRGCALRCAYCTYGAISGQAVRVRPPEDVLDDLELLVRGHGVKRLIFADSVFNVPREQAIAVCEGILDRGLEFEWRAYHHCKGLDREYMRLAVRAGCCEFTFSPDAWAAPTLQLLHKGIAADDIVHTMEVVRDTPSAVANYNFFLGLPGQTLRELAGILGFYARARRALGPRLTGFRLNHVRLEPGTALHREVVARGMFDADDPLLPGTDAELERLFLRRTGSRVLDGFCKVSRIQDWNLRPRPDVVEER